MDWIREPTPFMPRIIFYLAVPVCMTVMVIYLVSTLRRKSDEGHGSDA